MSFGRLFYLFLFRYVDQMQLNEARKSAGIQIAAALETRLPKFYTTEITRKNLHFYLYCFYFRCSTNVRDETRRFELVFSFLLFFSQQKKKKSF